MHSIVLSVKVLLTIKRNKLIKLLLLLVSLSLAVFFLSTVISSSSVITFNNGFSFGIGNFFFATLFSLISLTVIFYFIIRSEDQIKRILLSFIFIGGLANLIERLFYGVVHDYWNFVGLWYFNLADLIINLGAISLILFIIFSLGQPKTKLQRDSQAEIR